LVLVLFGISAPNIRNSFITYSPRILECLTWTPFRRHLETYTAFNQIRHYDAMTSTSDGFGPDYLSACPTTSRSCPPAPPSVQHADNLRLYAGHPRRIWSFLYATRRALLGDGASSESSLVSTAQFKWGCSRLTG